MKNLICLAFFALLALVNALPQEQRPGPCIGFTCGPKCKEDEYVYSSGCKPLVPPATCDNPNPQPENDAGLCDYMACYCKAPKVRNSDGKCVNLSECPSKCD